MVFFLFELQFFRTSAEVSEYLAELDELALRFADDPDAMSQIIQEREPYPLLLETLRESESRGVLPRPIEDFDPDPSDLL